MIKKTLPLLFICCFSGFYAQSSYEDLVNRLENHISQRQWDEIILLAPDLILEDPSRADAYYYISYAFNRMEQRETALGYLAKAEAIQDPALSAKIASLKKVIENGGQMQSFIEKAQQYEQQNQPASAADEWKRAWEADKSQSEYALNAVALFVGLKQYPQALEILDDPAVSNDPEAKKLIDRLNSTGQMKTINGYNNAFEWGEKYFNNGQYESALEKFEEALEFKPQDYEAYAMKKKTEDEIAWKKANNENSISSFEAYLSGNTNKKHADEAHGIIQRALIYHGENAAKAYKIEEMERFFNKFMATYPYDSRVAQVKRIMCDTYYESGLREAKLKEYYNQDNAIEFFTKAQNICADKRDLEKRLKVAERLKTRYGRPDRFFEAYVYDPVCKFGGSFGNITNRGVGFYGTARMNSGLFNLSDIYGTVTNDGLVSSSDYDSYTYHWQFTNETKSANFELMFGLTKQIFFPFWAYAGVGVGYNSTFWHMEVYDQQDFLYSDYWIKNTDETFTKPVFEGGLILDLYGLNLRSGVKLFNGQHYFTFGVGFSVEQ